MFIIVPEKKENVMYIHHGKFFNHKEDLNYIISGKRMDLRH